MNKNIFKIALAAGIVFMSMACNDFLDELPDKRAELDTEEKIAQMLISAYPTELSTMLFEFMSDNRTDNGPNYGISSLTAEQSYLFQDISDIDWDSPYRTWQQCYGAIASANQALEAIEKMGTPESILPTQAEALLCRAFAHFWLVNTFCIAYNPVSSDTDPGIPYVDEPETTVGKEYERHTVSYVYEKMNEDIENALPNIGSNYMVPKYHFNRQAAYAFAAKFNLFYGNWDKAIEYATQALGENPSRYLRPYDQYAIYTVLEDIHMRFISVDEPANFLMLTQRSLWGRIHAYNSVSVSRYGMSRAVTNKTFWQHFPWGDVADGLGTIWGSNQNLLFPKMLEIFEYSDVTAGIGQPHTVLCAFTGDETLFIRAEAYVMKGEFQLAANDLNTWYSVAKSGAPSYTYAQIVNHYRTYVDRNGDRRFDTPEMKSRFSDFTDDNQLYMLHAVQAAKRLETCLTGGRWLDIKRHGMIIKKPVMTTMQAGEYLVVAPYHGATAIQLPQDVILAGLPANDRPALEREPMQ